MSQSQESPEFLEKPKRRRGVDEGEGGQGCSRSEDSIDRYLALPTTLTKVTNPTSPPPGFDAYPMRKIIRGQALIIDNEKFDDPVEFPDRLGTTRDAKNLEALFRELGFHVIMHRNQDKRQMKSIVEEFSRLEAHGDADMCVVAILSHGNLGYVYSTDGKEVQLHWVQERLSHQNCPSLMGKPKFFVIQACRGGNRDAGYAPDEDATGFTKKRKRTRIPSFEDMLVAYATIPGYMAYRSLFVTALCGVFRQHSCHMDIRDMLDEVSKHVRLMESQAQFKQSCSHESIHFTKKLYFNPGFNAGV